MENSRLYRNQRDQIIGGVCSGLGDHLNVDPLLFRVLFVLAVLIGGSGILVYVILWIIIPANPDEPIINTNKNKSTMNDETMNNDSTQFSQPQQEPEKQKKSDGNLWGGLILITLGAIFLIDRFVPRIDFGDLWPVILIVVGVILISKSYQQTK